TATAPGSGVDHVAFPDLSSFNGFAGAGGNDTASPYASAAYSWTAGATGDPDDQDVVVTNNSSSTATATITITPDGSAPTGQSASLAGGPWYTSSSVPLTLDNGTDTGSGVDPASVVVERQQATLSNGTCDTFGSWSSVTLTAGADTTVAAGNCYR